MRLHSSKHSCGCSLMKRIFCVFEVSYTHVALLTATTPTLLPFICRACLCVAPIFRPNVQLRPGGHDTLPAKPIDVSAFSYSKRTAHQSPLSFLKRGTGNGGTVIPFGAGEDSTSSGQVPKGGGAPRASARRAAAVKKTKSRDFQVTRVLVRHTAERHGELYRLRACHTTDVPGIRL